MKRFVPITKIDEEKRMVYGLASDETVDAEDEVIDYPATKEAVADWVEWSNIREMHGPSAVGVATEVTLDDATKALYIGAHIVDDAAWEKCKAGVYKGFSIGGKALKKVMQEIGGRMVRRVVKYILTEISLVDRPANPSARFSLVKRQGGKMDGKDETAVEETAKVDGKQEEDQTCKAEGEDQGAAAAEGEGQAEGESQAGTSEEEKPGMTEETVKNVVIGLLKELGLVREQIAQAADVANLRKSLDERAPATDLQKVSGDLVKMGNNLTKLVGDLVKVAQAIDGLEERLEKLEQLPAGTGPVLREIGQFGVTDQTETVLKAVLADTNDPTLKQAIGQRLAELQIKSVHQQSQNAGASR